MKATGVILCAGKGTRMNDDTKNKVCFKCAGTPVIRRIVENMKRGGVERFVIVVGHKAESVMDALNGVDGVVYAYQKEQKGTGHAAMCGLRALKSMGAAGPVIISMGDKIISEKVIAELIERSKKANAVWCVQPLERNRSGGRVAMFGETPCGIVEFADAALMKLGEVAPNEYESTLESIGLNSKKAQKVIAAALNNKPEKTVCLNGQAFCADELLNSKYANAGLYCFDLDEAVRIIEGLGSNNAQGEVYITDAMECFARSDSITLYQIEEKTDMLTYSTKTELSKMNVHFMRRSSELIAAIDNGELDEMFSRLYSDSASEQKERYKSLLGVHIERYGDKAVVITRSPGRVNLMGRHIDHRGGKINVMATDKDTLMVASLRDDDVINVINLDKSYSERSFGISDELGSEKKEKWLDYLESERAVARLRESAGDWSNYVKSAVLRAQFETPIKLFGMDVALSGTIPVAAGLSSSSSIVVATMEAFQTLNCLELDDKKFIDLCGEGEWFVGSRGGAGDHAAMKCGSRDKIVQLAFKPFEVGTNASFSDKYAVIVANSGIKAKKSEGSKDKFNAKVAAYEFSFMLLKKKYPEYGFVEFRDIAKVRPHSKIYEMLRSLPEAVTREEVAELLPGYKNRIQEIFKTHAEPKCYELRGVALFGISECVRAERCMELLQEGKYNELGRMMKISHNGDRIFDEDISDEKLKKLEADNSDVAEQCGAYGCSTEQIDYLCDLLNGTSGVLGSELVGAGLGGCVIALVEKERSAEIIKVINEKYYDKYGIDHLANVYFASAGSSVTF